MNKNYIIGLIVFMMIATSAIPMNAIADMSSTESISDLNYTHGITTYNNEGIVDYSKIIDIDEEYKKTVMFTGEFPLITDYNHIDTLFQVISYKYFPYSNGTEIVRKFLFRNDTVYNYLENELWPYIQSLPDPKVNITTDEVHKVYLLSTARKYLGSTHLNSTTIEFMDKWLILPYYHAISIIPLALLIDIQTTDYEVTINQTFYSRQILKGALSYYLDYSASMTGYHVKITDGKNIGVNYYGCISSTMSYTENYWTNLAFYRLFVHNVTITSTDTSITDDYGNVLYKHFPRFLLPSYYEDSGLQVVSWNTTGTYNGRSTTQAAVQAFVSRSINDTVDNFAVWGAINPSRMIAYYDGNDNSQLDVIFNENGKIRHDPELDWVKYVGFPQAFEHTKDIDYAVYQNYTRHVFAPAAGIDNEWNLEGFIAGEKSVVRSVGDISADIDVETRWDEPVENDDGSITFSWGMDYNEYPVIWYNTTDSKTLEEKMDLSYDYVYTVNLEQGEARLSTTSTFGDVTGTALANDVEDLSLASYQISELFTVEKIVGKTPNGTISSSVLDGTATIEIAYSDDIKLVEIGLGANKKTYQLGGNTYDTTTSVINLFEIIGQATIAGTDEVDEFSSEDDNLMTALVSGQEQTTTYNWLHRRDVIIIDYPVWGGEEIVHDPDFITYFEGYEPSGAPWSLFVVLIAPIAIVLARRKLKQ